MPQRILKEAGKNVCFPVRILNRVFRQLREIVIRSIDDVFLLPASLWSLDPDGYLLLKEVPGNLPSER